MIYNNKQELISLLRQNNIYLKKGLGQNFLINPQILQTIIAAAEIKPTDHIIEIGPGFGILTTELAQKAKQVDTIEIDTGIIDTLKKNLAGHSNVQIINQDALKFPLPAEDYKLVANIPYYITSPILNHFLNLQPEPGQPAPKRPQLIILLVQKEVAEKVCSQAGDHSILSLEVQIYGKPSIIGKVPKGNFFPEPKVDSAILKIETYPKPLIEDTKTFFKIIKAAFSQRRKTLNNSLRGGLPLTKEVIDQIFQSSQISPGARPQELTIPEWQKLVEAYKLFAGNQSGQPV